MGARHFHTSAKQNRGIEELFLDLAQQMMATADKKAKGGGGGGGGTRTDGATGGGRNNIRIVDDIEVRTTPRFARSEHNARGDIGLISYLFL